MQLLRNLGNGLLIVVVMCLSGNAHAQVGKIIDGVGYGLSIVNAGKTLEQADYDEKTGQKQTIRLRRCGGGANSGSSFRQTKPKL